MGILTRLGFGTELGVPAGPGEAMRPDDEAWAVALAVAENLRLVLNSKQGSGYYLSGFGLGSYNQNASAAEALPTLVREITDNVTRFEPRLGGAHVEPLGRDVSWLRLRLTGTIAGVARTLELGFHVSFGIVRVEVVDDERRDG
jgi:predicted component of type VI protein secretion system